MDDVREKLVELIRSGRMVREGIVGLFTDYLIANGVTVQGWIPVSEPPKVWREENGNLVNYLIYTPECGVDIGNYAQPAECWLCMGIPCKVTHWSPLPQPPKGE